MLLLPYTLSTAQHPHFAAALSYRARPSFPPHSTPTIYPVPAVLVYPSSASKHEWFGSPRRSRDTRCLNIFTGLVVRALFHYHSHPRLSPPSLPSGLLSMASDRRQRALAAHPLLCLELPPPSGSAGPFCFSPYSWSGVQASANITEPYFFDY